MIDKTIAVLPFVNMSANAENEYFSDGITEEIINALAQIESLRVTSRTSSFYFKNKNIPIRQIGKELSVSTLLEGSVRLAGDTIRITAQLIQAADDFHFWSESWDRKLENIFEIQDEISLLIAEKLREQLGHFEIGDHLVVKQTDNVDAYDYALKARYHFNRWNPEDVKTAIALYEKALELDPNHTKSLVELADSYSFLAMTGFMPFEEAWKKSNEIIARALRISDQLPGAYYQLANMSFFTECDFKASYKHISMAIQLKPNYVEAQQFMSFLYVLSGNEEKAREHLGIALSIDPLSQETLFYSAYLDYMTENYSKSLKQLDKCIEVNPKNIPAHSVKTLCLLKMQRYEEVIGYFETVPQDVVIIGEKTGTLALAYSLIGDAENNIKYTDQLLEQAAGENGFTASSYLFLVWAAMGQNDKAFEWIENAIQTKSSLLLLRYADPIVNPIKSDPRFRYFHKLIFNKDENKPKPEKKPLLDIGTAESATLKLLSLMEVEHPYLDSELSLKSLAALVEIHPNQLSWLLNESLGKNFSEFINHFRVEAFKRMAKDPRNAKLTILGMAYDCGFNSKTVFNTYFKKETALTPKQFLKESKD